MHAPSRLLPAALGLLLLLPTPARAARERKASAAAGRITYLTRGAAYLDRGGDAGLQAGTRLILRRRRQKVGSCEVVEVSSQRAVCQGEDLAVGDRFFLPAAVRAKARSPKPALKPRPLPAGIGARITAARPKRVPFRGAGSAREGKRRLRFPAAATLRHRSWGMLRADSGYHQEAADLSVNGLPLGALDAHLHADLSVLGWSGRSDDARYLPDRSLVFHVRELAGDLGLGKLPLRISLGRFQPRGVPGVSRLDGVQLSWSSSGGALRAGAYGGALPGATRLEPGLEQWSSGLFLRHGLRRERFSIREELRVSYAHTLLDPARVDAEARASLELPRRLNLDLRGRLALLSTAAPGPRLDFGSARLNFTPMENAGLEAAYLSLASGAGDPDALLLRPSPGLQRAQVGAYWGPSAKIRLAVRGHWDRTVGLTARDRLAFGPDLLLRDLLGERSLLQLGYREELGFLAGRFLFAVHRVELSRRARLSTRLSISQLGPPETGRYPVLEGGGASDLTVDLRRNLSLRAGVELRGGDHGAGYGLHLSATGRL